MDDAADCLEQLINCQTHKKAVIWPKSAKFLHDLKLLLSNKPNYLNESCNFCKVYSSIVYCVLHENISYHK